MCVYLRPSLPPGVMGSGDVDMTSEFDRCVIVWLDWVDGDIGDDDDDHGEQSALIIVIKIRFTRVHQHYQITQENITR